MRAESEFGYEPSLLLEMERMKVEEDGKKMLTHRCFVIKDRADILTGQSFDNPTFEDILPSISILNFGGEHKGVDLEKDSQDIFGETGEPDWVKEQKLRKVKLDEIKTELKLFCPSNSQKDRQEMVKLLEICFGTRSWVALEEDPDRIYSSPVLNEGLKKLQEEIKKRAIRKNGIDGEIKELLKNRIVPDKLQAETKDILEQGTNKEKIAMKKILEGCPIKTK